jgi:hypothetical protein
MNQEIFVLMEEGDFVAAYTTREKAEAEALELELHNWHIIEAKIR